jgi:type I restriction enzyme S subunit
MYGEGKTRGKVSELRLAAATNQACAALVFERENAKFKPFIKVFLAKHYEDLRRESSGGVQPNLNLSIIKAIKLPFPPLPDQGRIVAEAERRLSVIEALESAVDHGMKRAERLRQSVLKRAFEGRLVPQDPNDEPASVLLERIRAERTKSPQASMALRQRTRRDGVQVELREAAGS